MAPEVLRAALPAVKRFVAAPEDVSAYGAFLYEALHELDAAGADRILIARPSDAPEWAAVDDRLGRATA